MRLPKISLPVFSMPSFFSKKKPNPVPAEEPTTAGTPPSPEKKSKGYFVREREKDPKQKSPRSSKSFSRSNPYEHPLNLPPDELRRLSALSTSMSSPRDSREDGGVPVNPDPMETTPAPETPGSFPQTNGLNGDHQDSDDQENRPTPPPHRTKTSPSPQPERSDEPKKPEKEKPEIREAEAEAYKAAGNKLYKAGQYGSAIDEYTKGRYLIFSFPYQSLLLRSSADFYSDRGQPIIVDLSLQPSSSQHVRQPIGRST